MPNDKATSQRTVADHLKAGVKNVPKMYNTLYNRPAGPGGGASTVPTNIKVAATGRTGKDMPKVAASTRAKIVGMGALSVTPLGPVAAAVSGVVKSVQAKSQAKANLAAAKTAAPASAPKLNTKSAAPAPKPGATAPAPKAPARPTTPAPAMGAKANAKPGSAAPAPGAKPGPRKS
jgi:translation initiation factor IF-2